MAEIKIEDLYSKGGVPLQNQVQRNTTDIASLKLDIRNTAGTPVLSTAWVQLRTSMWNGYVPADGQLLKRADYPDAWATIQAGKVPVTSDAAWLASSSNRGCFSTGDGSTTFRVPDYNGKSDGSMGRVFLSGDGLNSSGINGVIQGDAIRNIVGEFNLIGASAIPLSTYAGDPTFGGAFSSDGTVSSPFLGAHYSTTNQARASARFDASRVVPTAADNHPVNVTGCWAVKLFGAVQNAGEIDAMGLATQVANLDSNKLDKANVVAPMANGGVIERGSNANGEYVKFADGTMIWTLSKVLPTGTTDLVPPVTMVGTYYVAWSTAYTGGYAPYLEIYNTNPSQLRVHEAGKTDRPANITYLLTVTGRWK